VLVGAAHAIGLVVHVHKSVNLEIEKSMAKRSLRVQGSMRVVVSQDGHALSLLR